MASQPGELTGQLAMFADGAPTPPVTSFAVYKSFSRSVNVTKAHDMPWWVVPLSMVGSSLWRQRWIEH
jgi:hypothetical protein